MLLDVQVRSAIATSCMQRILLNEMSHAVDTCHARGNLFNKMSCTQAKSDAMAKEETEEALKEAQVLTGGVVVME